jgi:hypothetical protein
MAQAAEDGEISGGYRISECNSYATPINGVTNAEGAALWALDFLFANAMYQSTGVNFMGGGDTNNFTPIYDDGTNVVRIGPDYYAMFAYARLLKGGKLMTTKVTPSPSTFSAYAIEEPDGSTDLVLNNRSASSNFTVAIAAPHASQASAILLTGPSLTATSGFTLGGSAINTNGTWEPAVTTTWPIVEDSAIVTVPAGSAQMVHID